MEENNIKRINRGKIRRSCNALKMCEFSIYIINDNNRKTQKQFEQAQRCGWVKSRLKQ